MGGGGAARAEALVTSVSRPRIAIQSNFAGEDIVVFGGIQKPAALAPHGRYDIVVTVRGPSGPIDVREKARSLGIWINTNRRHFENVPSYFAIASSRPVSEITSPDTIARFGLSLDSATDLGIAPPRARDSEFRAALIRLRREEGLFIDQPKGVVFLSDDLFRATISLPANVPLGFYQVETRLLVDGEVVTGQRASLRVIKTGLDARVAQWARRRSALYGLATCAIALSLGWLATIVFRGD
jgi:uncharacterized protein (TIGR02186 family)